MGNMIKRNDQLKRTLGAMAPKERVQEVASIPREDTVNRDGFKTYSLTDELRLISMLNTLKIKPQFYRTEDQTISELRDLIERIGLKDPYFVCQAIVYSRCMGEGMRTINNLSAALVAPFIRGEEYAKRFYSLFDRKAQKGGCIYRPDDMTEIKDAYCALNSGVLTNAMRKGFKDALERFDGYQMSKYPDNTINIANLVHPSSKVTKDTVEINGRKMKVLDALMRGFTVAPDTWDSMNSEAGQIVKAAVKAGKIDQKEAEEMLAEAKTRNWEALLEAGRLPIMAALRNIRNILTNPSDKAIRLLCELITNEKIVKESLILPSHFDLAYDVVMKEFASADYSPDVQKALIEGYQKSIPNLALVLPGKTLIIQDVSGSMQTNKHSDGKTYSGSNPWGGPVMKDSCCYKAGLISATIIKATGADLIFFGDRAREVTYNKNLNVFALASELGKAYNECTNLSYAFNLIRMNRSAYDRIIILSDNEINTGNLMSAAYKQYVHDVCSPYVYCVDLAAYGTVPLAGDKVSFFYGYGSTLYEDLSKNEFNPAYHIDKVRAVVI